MKIIKCQQEWDNDYNIFNVNGIAILDILPKSTHMNSTIFISNVLEPFMKYPQLVELKK